MSKLCSQKNVKTILYDNFNSQESIRTHAIYSKTGQKFCNFQYKIITTKIKFDKYNFANFK